MKIHKFGLGYSVWLAALTVSLFFAASNSTFSEEKPKQKESEGLRFKIIGDQEAPAVRYFVPWKTPSDTEMLLIPTPEMKALEALDPRELQREIDYYSRQQKTTTKPSTAEKKID